MVVPVMPPQIDKKSSVSFRLQSHLPKCSKRPL
nr:MAG TPA: U1/U12 small nuclear ribonucleoprotein [Caudoviricetes sp.]